MELHTAELIPPNFTEQFKDILRHGHTEYINEGGRGSCKSSSLSIFIILLIIQNPSYNALIVRKVTNTLRDSVYSQLKWAVEKLGVSHLFNFTLAPLQAVYLPTGQNIFFRGADDPLKIKSIKATRGYIAITWFEEVAEFSPADIESIKLSTMRGGVNFYNFYSYNPPSSTRSWVNTDLKKPRPDRYILRSDYRTVPRAWLGEAFIYEAEEMKRTNERSYKNIFLGEPTGTGANIFENIELRKITDEEVNGFEWNYYGLDFGFYPDPLRFVAMSYSIKDKILYIYGELSLLKHGNYEASEKLREYLEAHEIPLNIKIIGDSAEPKSIQDFFQYGFNIHGAQKGKGSLEAGFKWLQQLKKIVIDPERAPKSADEFSLYEYERDKKTGEILSGYPQGQPDHTLAAVRYALEEVWKRKGN